MHAEQTPVLCLDQFTHVVCVLPLHAPPPTIRVQTPPEQAPVVIFEAAGLQLTVDCVQHMPGHHPVPPHAFAMTLSVHIATPTVHVVVHVGVAVRHVLAVGQQSASSHHCPARKLHSAAEDTDSPTGRARIIPPARMAQSANAAAPPTIHRFCITLYLQFSLGPSVAQLVPRNGPPGISYATHSQTSPGAVGIPRHHLLLRATRKLPPR